MMRRRLFTLLSNLFFVWILVHYAMGGLVNGWWLLTHNGLLPWVMLGLVLFLIFYRSDAATDLPLFAAGWLLGYWGEWWGTTRGVWTYWNGATPPDYLPPLWGIGLITVYRLSRILLDRLPPEFSRAGKWMAAALFTLPLLAALAFSLPLLQQVDWRGRLDGHFFAGIITAALLIAWRFDLRETLALYLCGMLLGGLYETLGTTSGEWRYITAEMPPLWIAPLWGFAAAAMTRLSRLITTALVSGLTRLAPRQNVLYMDDRAQG